MLSLSEFSRILLESYNEILDRAFSFFEPYVLASLREISRLFRFDPELYSHWRHTFLIFGTYAATDIRSYFSRGLPFVTIFFTILLALTLVTLVSVASGLFPLQAPSGLALLLPILGFAAYEMLKAPITGYYLPINDLTKWKTTVYYFFWYGVVNVFLGLAAFFVVFIFFGIGGDASVIVLVVFLIFLSIRNILVALRKAFKYPPPDGAVCRSFASSGSTQVAIGVISSLLFSFFLVLISVDN